MESNQIVSEGAPIESVEYTAKPEDSRCKYWCKIVRDGQMLPLPHAVHGAAEIPGDYLRKGDDIEIFEGDYILEGEENHHVKQRGWRYNLGKLVKATAEKEAHIAWCEYGKPVKDACRAAGYKVLLGGAGDVAAMVRSIHARREGIWPGRNT